jgi:hypothetical protein
MGTVGSTFPFPKQPNAGLPVQSRMTDPSAKTKPVEPTGPQASSHASNPRDIRAERPDARTQVAGTPDGGDSPPAGKPGPRAR